MKTNIFVEVYYNKLHTSDTQSQFHTHTIHCVQLNIGYWPKQGVSILKYYTIGTIQGKLFTTYAQKSRNISELSIPLNETVSYVMRQ